MKILNITTSRTGIGGTSFVKVKFTITDYTGILYALINTDTKDVFVIDPLNLDADFRGNVLGAGLLNDTDIKNALNN